MIELRRDQNSSVGCTPARRYAYARTWYFTTDSSMIDPTPLYEPRDCYFSRGSFEIVPWCGPWIPELGCYSFNAVQSRSAGSSSVSKYRIMQSYEFRKKTAQMLQKSLS